MQPQLFKIADCPEIIGGDDLNVYNTDGVFGSHQCSMV